MITQTRFPLFAAFLFLASHLLRAGTTTEADLGVLKTGPAQAAAGSNVSYTVEVSNFGPDDSLNATLTDQLPAGMTFVSLTAPAGWMCTTPVAGANGTVTCTNSDFLANGDDFFTLVVKIDAQTAQGTTFTNIAQVSSQGTFDPNDENNSSAASTTVPEPTADLAVMKTVDSDQVLANSNVTFTIQISNEGPDAASNAQLTDTLPGDMTFVSLQAQAGWLCTHPVAGNGGTITCTNASVANGTTSTFVLVGHIPQGESSGTLYLNTAFINSDNDPNPENDSDDASTSVVAAAPTLTTQATLPTTFGAPISDTATLSGGSGATGTINFFAYGPSNSPDCSGTPVFTSSVSVNGDGNYNSGSFVPSAAGTYYFVASYSGDTNNKATSTVCGDANESTQVSQGFTSTTLTTSKSPTVFGESVTFTATVTPQPPATAMPTGQVQFFVDNVAFAGPITLNGGTAQLTTNSIGAGSHTIKASYLGDDNYVGSNATTTQVVNKDATTTGVTSSANPSASGQSVTFTATVTANSPGSGTPTGTAQFVIDGASAGGPVTLSNGMAQFTTSTLTAAGSPHSVTAQYSGDGNFLASSGSLSGGQTVTAPTPTPTATATPIATATPTATPTSTPAQTLNISTRLRVQIGDNVGIAGFIIRGNASKPVVLRGLGPSLVNMGLPAASVLNDPIIELHGPNGALITSNDNWKDSPQRSQIEGTPFQPTDDRESVIVATLAPGAYTGIIKGVGQTMGIGVIEVYDNNQALDSDLANISTRGFVQTGNDVMIAGFILGGNNNPTNIAVRALGPSLANSGLSNVLADPMLELHNANGTIMVANDDWQSDPVSAAQLTANGLALPNPKESGIFTSLAPPGQFTAVVMGKNGGVGVALVEIYDLR